LGESVVNKVAIPKYYWKVVLDKDKQRGIGFVLPNAPANKPLELYSVTIYTVERLSGLNFFPGLPADIKGEIARQRETKDWFAEVASGDVEPVPIKELKRGQISTIMAPSAMGSSRTVTVVGKVVSGRTSLAGNVLLNLDKQYPNEIFSVFIKKDDLPNFPYDILPMLQGNRIAVTGKVSELGGKPIMYISSGKDMLIVEGD
jgi:endonuclease G